MHSKIKGNIGQFAAAVYLAKFGFSIFTEEGDISQIDLIAEREGKLLRFQCKASTPKKGVLKLCLRKYGPNYCFTYKEKDIDFFSLYDLENENLYIVPSSVLQRCKNMFVLRLNKSKNNQTKGINLPEDYLADRILRDYTDNTLTSKVEGDDIVQTTTL